MDCSCSDIVDEFQAQRKERRKHLDDVARKMKKAVELCADHCEFELGKHGAELLTDAKNGNIAALKEMLETVDQWQPAVWSIRDAESVELALVAVEYLEYGLLAIGAPATDS